LFILFVIAVALAPLAHFQPSKRQRQIARLREYAAVHGMFVEFRSVPGRDSGRLNTRDSAGHEIIYYGKRLPAARGHCSLAGAWLRQGSEWAGLQRTLAAPAGLAQLPAQVLAASVDQSSCGVYWQESGAVEDVEQIRQVLEHWAGEIGQ
jgi:hypothetical protein